MVVPLNATSPNPGRSFRFTRQFRLKSPLVIRRILQDGQSVRRRFDAFRLVASRTGSKPTPAFAFVVSRDAGTAVERSRIKRRLREAVRLQPDSWPAAPVDVVFRVNNGDAAIMDFDRLKNEVRLALEIAGRAPSASGGK